MYESVYGFKKMAASELTLRHATVNYLFARARFIILFDYPKLSDEEKKKKLVNAFKHIERHMIKTKQDNLYNPPCFDAAGISRLESFSPSVTVKSVAKDLKVALKYLSSATDKFYRSLREERDKISTFLAYHTVNPTKPRFSKPEEEEVGLGTHVLNPTVLKSITKYYKIVPYWLNLIPKVKKPWLRRENTRYEELLLKNNWVIKIDVKDSDLSEFKRAYHCSYIHGGEKHTNMLKTIYFKFNFEEDGPDFISPDTPDFWDDDRPITSWIEITKFDLLNDGGIAKYKNKIVESTNIYFYPLRGQH